LNTCFDSHFSDELLEKYALGRVSVLDCASLEGHLLICSDCQTHLATIEEYLAVMRAALAELEVHAQARMGAQSAIAL
jgi:anti-sigma factor ChrR (cupin superfamily)